MSDICIICLNDINDDLAEPNENTICKCYEHHKIHKECLENAQKYKKDQCVICSTLYDPSLDSLKHNGLKLKFCILQTNEKCLESVKQNSYALYFVKNQTKEICLEAVKQDGYVLKYVKEQTNEICLEAVKQNGHALKYVKEQTNEIC